MRRIIVLALAVVVGVCVAALAFAATAEGGSGDVSAQYEVALTITMNVLYDDGSGQWWWDGIVENPAGSPTSVRTPQLIIYYHSSGEAQVGDAWYTLPSCWALPPGSQAAFHIPITLPGAYNHAHTSAVGQSTSSPYELLSMSSQSNGLLDYGWRWRTVRVINTKSYTVVGIMLNVYETMDTGGGAQWWDVMGSGERFQSRLAPGEWVDIMVRGKRPRWGGDAAGSVFWATAKAAPASDPVYRFYNKKTGTHFYTIDPTERNDVIAKLGWLYTYEGPAYQAYSVNNAAETPLFRFFNKQTGTHFYTADWNECTAVIAKLSWLYNYEGVGYYVCDSGGAATSAAYRFYNKRSGTHFYTVDLAERDNVIAKLGWLYTYEGPAYSVPKPSGGSI